MCHRQGIVEVMACLYHRIFLRYSLKCALAGIAGAHFSVLKKMFYGTHSEVGKTELLGSSDPFHLLMAPALQ